MRHRGEVGPKNRYDLIGAQQFCILVDQGLRENHDLLDFGCGSLRAGRILIPWLAPGKYVGVDPNKWLIDDGIQHETGHEIHKMKGTEFHYFSNFRLSTIGRNFDFILAQSVLSHAGWDLVEEFFRQGEVVLRPKGKILATFFQGENRGSEGWLGHGIATYPVGFMKRAANRAGLSFTVLPYKHPVGQKWFLAERER